MPKRAEVDQWYKRYNSPLKATMERVREIFLADPRVDECIKWRCPTFTYLGNMASFNPRAKQHVSIMFHTGAEIPGNHPVLRGSAISARFVNITSVADAAAKEKALRALVRAWCNLREAKAAPTQKPATKKHAKRGKKAPAKKPVARKRAKRVKKTPTKKASGR